MKLLRCHGGRPSQIGNSASANDNMGELHKALLYKHCSNCAPRDKATADSHQRGAVPFPLTDGRGKGKSECSPPGQEECIEHACKKCIVLHMLRLVPSRSDIVQCFTSPVPWSSTQFCCFSSQSVTWQACVTVKAVALNRSGPKWQKKKKMHQCFFLEPLAIIVSHDS